MSSFIANPKICLNMIVKNEEKNIVKCFDSIINFIDYYVISDTGSTDNTIATIKNYFDNKAIEGKVIEGKVIEDEWKDFSHNRNLALKYAREFSNCDYIFIMDADDYLVNDMKGLREELSNNIYDIYYLKMSDEKLININKKPLLFKINLICEFILPVHETLKFYGEYKIKIIMGEYAIVSGRKGPVRNENNPNKYINDANMLINYIENSGIIKNHKFLKTNLTYKEGDIVITCYNLIAMNYLYQLNIINDKNGVRNNDLINKNSDNIDEIIYLTDKAIEYFSSEINLSKSIGLKLNTIYYSYYQIARLLSTKTSEYSDKIVEIFKTANSLQPLCNMCLNEFGLYYVKYGEYSKAKELYEKALGNCDYFTDKNNSNNIANLSFYSEYLNSKTHSQRLIDILNLAENIKNNSEFINYDFYLFKKINSNSFLKSSEKVFKIKDIINFKNISESLSDVTGFTTLGDFKTGFINKNDLKIMDYTVKNFDTFEGIFIKKRKVLVFYMGYQNLTKEADDEQRKINNKILGIINNTTDDNVNNNTNTNNNTNNTNNNTNNTNNNTNNTNNNTNNTNTNTNNNTNNTNNNTTNNKTVITNINAYGSELAATKLAEQLSNTYEVFMISNDKINKNINNVNYWNYGVFEKYYEEHNIVVEILILSRYLNYFVEYSFKPHKIYLWLHDTYIATNYRKFGLHALSNNLHSIDKIIVLSEWHKSFVQKTYNITDPNKLMIIGNGINPNNVVKFSKINLRFIWTSSMDRGIERCVEVFHKIHKDLPEATLHIFRDYVGYEHLVDKWDYIKFYGKVNNERIIEEFGKAVVWFYPTHFTETYCISSLEAQSNKCLCICTNGGSLSTVVGNRGHLINPSLLNNTNELHNFVMKCLYDKNNINLLNEGRKFADTQTWENISKIWINMFRF